MARCLTTVHVFTSVDPTGNLAGARADPENRVDMSDSTQNPPPEDPTNASSPPPPPVGSGQPDPVQPGPAQPGPAQPGPAQPGPAQPGPAQPGPAQPGFGQPGPDQPGGQYGPPGGQYGPPGGQYGQPMGAPGYGPPSGVGQPAELMSRFLARLIDMVIVGVVNAIITVILVAGVLSLDGSGFGITTGASFAASAVTAVISAALYLGYFTFLESRDGQTIGKKALKLQTQAPDGSTPTTEQSVRRNAWVALGILGVVPVIGSLLGSLLQLAAIIAIAVTINSSPTRQGWHDKFAGGTRVIKIG
jgi:uncharacterized RDD family membrane protein YckC